MVKMTTATITTTGLTPINLAYAVMLPTCIQKVSVSNLVRNTDYTALGSFVVYLLQILAGIIP
jgi:hypothetical protein